MVAGGYLEKNNMALRIDVLIVNAASNDTWEEVKYAGKC